MLPEDNVTGKLTDERFVKLSRDYEREQDEQKSVLREFIDRIYVSAAVKHSRTREIEIVYNFIGAFDFKAATEQANSEKSA